MVPKRLEADKKSKIKAIIELYTAVQSEGSRQGYPTIVVRTTGCTHRCFFGEGGWCDSWYTSIHPEKARYSFDDIVKMYDENPHIKEMMLTGGSPTMHPDLVNELTIFAKERDIYITIETEGSHFLETEQPINLLSISPKFENSVPVLGAVTPEGKITDERMIKQHNKFRLHIDNIADSIIYHSDFHLKPVIDKDLKVMPEVEKFIKDLAQNLFDKDFGSNAWFDGFENTEEIEDYLKSKTWLMPAGDDRPSLMESYGPVMDLARDKGYKFTGRAHIIAFDTQREV
jgi:7-carboxy-7-deazaguanine synthase